MASAEEALGKIATTISNTLSRLETELQQSLQYWTGPTQAQYWIAKHAWDAKAADMPVALQMGEQTLSSINDNYGSAERINTSLFGG
jgi:WXG100 family type VII secretion target